MSKRAFDILVGSVAFVATAPVAALVAAALKFEGRGPIFYITSRVGQDGRVFRLLRFRTMVDASPDVAGDDRETPVGRFIRNYSLDDLPQLFNVLKGDLSIIGPRPFEVKQVDPYDPSWRKILSIRPGLISYSILHLNRRYNTSSLAEKQALELEYVDRQSLRFDIHVLGSALLALARSRGNVKLRG